MINGEVLVRTYRKDGTFYRGGWSSLFILWDRGYKDLLIGLQRNGKASRVVNGVGIVEMILVS